MIDVDQVKDLMGDQLPTEEEFEAKKQELIGKAAKVLHLNQECYVAQWILHNQDKDFNDYELSFKWRDDGFGYNVYMVKKGEQA